MSQKEEARVLIEADRLNVEDHNFFATFGRGDSEFVMVKKWTNDIAVCFPSLRRGLKIKYLGRRKQLKDVPCKEIVNFGKFRLNDLQEKVARGRYAERKTIMVEEPLLVKVVGKKKSDLVIKDNGHVLLIGSMFVADDTGYCKLILFNEAVETLHDVVKEGDWLYLETYQYSADKYLHVSECLFPENKYFNLELKINGYQVFRSSFFQICSHVKKRPFTIPFIPERVKFPSQILHLDSPNLKPVQWKSISTFKKLRKETEAHLASKTEGHSVPQKSYFDVTGIVSYVGPVWRSQRYVKTVQKGIVDRFSLEQDGRFFERFEKKWNVTLHRCQDFQDVVQYNSFRWLRLVDSASKISLPFRLYINKSNWDLQKKIVPGTLILISKCNEVEVAEKGFSYACESSLFSHVYLGQSVHDYMLTNTRHAVVDMMRLCLNRRKFDNLLANERIEWSYGGVPLTFSFMYSFDEFSSRCLSDKNYCKAISFQPLLKKGFVQRQTEIVHCFGTIENVSWVQLEKSSKTGKDWLKVIGCKKIEKFPQDENVFQNHCGRGTFNNCPLLGYLEEISVKAAVVEGFSDPGVKSVKDLGAAVSEKLPDIGRSMAPNPSSTFEFNEKNGVKKANFEYFLVNILSEPLSPYPKVCGLLNGRTKGSVRYCCLYRCFINKYDEERVQLIESMKKFGWFLIQISSLDDNQKDLQVDLIDWTVIKKSQFDNFSQSLNAIEYD